MYFAMNLMIMTGILVCRSFINSVCLFIVSCTTAIVRPRASIVYCRHRRVLCFMPVLRGCDWVVCCYVRKKTLRKFVGISERSYMGLYGMPLFMYL